MRKTVLLGLILVFSGARKAAAQLPPPTELAAAIAQFKADPRGPYLDIRWYCPDGTNQPANQPCGVKGSMQHARLKPTVERWAQNGLHIGQILAGTAPADFWANDQRRLKQYIIEKYLQAADNGWASRRAQHYRGALQAEDESLWGLNFYNWLSAQPSVWQRNFYLIRQSAYDVPHEGDTDRTKLIRALSKSLSDKLPSFMPVRIKIHGNPQPVDVESVKSYLRGRNLSPAQKADFERLIAEMEAHYATDHRARLKAYSVKIVQSPSIQQALKATAETEKPTVASLADLLWRIRLAVAFERPENAAHLLDASIAVEQWLLSVNSTQMPNTMGESLGRIHQLAKAAAGTGLLEEWEWREFDRQFQITPTDSLSAEQLQQLFSTARRVVEWASAMPAAVFADQVALFASFEPMANGFIDDKVRSSLALALGAQVSAFGAELNRRLNASHRVSLVTEASQMRGLNAGMALAVLHVVSGSELPETLDSKAIYAFENAPSDLKPVAGIFTVSEGNLVSHVQLLARNLGIPNAVITTEHLAELKAHEGAEVFYTVGTDGTIQLIKASEMSAAERALFAEAVRSEQKIAIPTEKLDLKGAQLINLRQLRASSSGITCGPKAANLGELKHRFPDQVVEGFAIPFAVFKQHMNQWMNEEGSYWQFLENTFSQASEMAEAEAESYVLQRLSTLRSAIATMPLLPDFQEALRVAFTQILGAPMGSVPVFLRSDTNMEDLADFTGAGLNLTVFNAVTEQAILQGIRDVWASPYTERSYRWRHKYLNNPTEVYPSILVIPSVDVERSGVMITGRADQGTSTTVAFSLGAGGAVDGQKAETWQWSNGSPTLLSPSREAMHKRLPKTGGTEKRRGDFNTPILTHQQLDELAAMATEVNTDQSENRWDVELGFTSDKLWLFQIRPFVENASAQNNQYLKAQKATSTRFGLSEKWNSTL